MSELIALEIDADGDGYLNDNEFRTLALIVEGKEPSSGIIGSTEDIMVYV